LGTAEPVPRQLRLSERFAFAPRQENFSPDDQDRILERGVWVADELIAHHTAQGRATR
jgi:hypothetical protein